MRQVADNCLKKDAPVTIVFGKPVAFGDLLDGPPSAALHQRISEHALDAVRVLGEEERTLRARLPKR